MSTLIVANLDCELEWAGAPPLPATVRARIAALGTLLRVLAPDDDTALELVAAIDPDRVPAVPGVARPRLVARGHRLTPGAVRAWGATAAWPSSGDVEAARRACDRRLAAGLGARDDAEAVTSIDALAARLPAIVEASPTGAWVAKATLCAAGRDRVRRRGANLDDATRTRLARLLARGGALIVEPWRERVLDLGQPGAIDAAGVVTLVPPHRLRCDDGGGFLGVTIGADPEVGAHGPALAVAGHAAGAAIAALGYRGPFVVDAFVHRDRGATRLRAVVEINPRLSFGWLARAWAERLGDGTLMVGRGAPPAGAIALLTPGATDDTSAWWQLAAATSSRR